MGASVLLIRPSSRRVATVVPPLGLGYLATALERGGHRTALFDGMRERRGTQGLSEVLAGGAFQIIGVQVYSCDLPAARGILLSARRFSPRSTIVVGGPHPSAAPLHTLEYLSEADYAFRGEAEAGFPRLAAMVASGRGVRPEEVENLEWRRDATGTQPGAPWHPQDLDALGFPAWHLMPPRSYPPFPHGFAAHGFPVGSLVITRGCPYPCTFCSARNITGTRLRSRSITNVMEEIRALHDRYGVREIHIEDDSFSVDPRLVSRFCEAMERSGLGLTWSCPNGIRLERIDERELALMSRSGCHSFAVGIESGSQRIRERMRKELDLGEIRRKLAIARSLGIRATGFFMIGYPGETEEDIRRTIALARSLDLARAQFSVFLPLPGTPVFDELTRNGELAEPRWEDLLTTGGGVYAPGGMSLARMRRIQKRAFLSFYRRPRTFLGLLRELRSARHLVYLLRRGLAVFG